MDELEEGGRENLGDIEVSKEREEKEALWRVSRSGDMNNLAGGEWIGENGQ